MKTYQLTIDGMSCHHCVMAVKKELSKINGVHVNDVSIGSSELDVDETKVTENDLRDAVKEAGYTVVSIN